MKPTETPKTSVVLLEHPHDRDWARCRARAMVTVGRPYDDTIVPAECWRERILSARHSPIRCLWFSFYIENIPSNIATHFARHVHAQPYVSSLRNDRQKKMDGDMAPRSTPVDMILDVNAEELMVIANKRLCGQASAKTREITRMMVKAVVKACPEFEPFLVPMCVYHGGVCHEMKPCGYNASLTR